MINLFESNHHSWKSAHSKENSEERNIKLNPSKVGDKSVKIINDQVGIMGRRCLLY